MTINTGVGTQSPDRKLVVRGGEPSLQQEGWQTPFFLSWVLKGPLPEREGA